MLKRLYISNYILIDELEASFSSGFTAFTGETGAGKSIILGALNYLLGARLEGRILKNESQKTILEAELVLASAGKLKPWFDANDFDFSDSVFIRREFLPSGKGRAFINDTPAKVSQLAELGSKLVDVHMQGHVYSLMSTDYQTQMVDAFANNQSLVSDFQAEYKTYKQTLAEKQQKVKELQEAISDRDYLEYQLNELNQLPWQRIENESIEEKLNAFEHAEEIQQGVGQALNLLRENDDNALQNIQRALQILQPLVTKKSSFKEITERLHSLEIELDDVVNELEESGYHESIDEAEYQELKRLGDLINRLLFKHKLANVEELRSLQEDIAQRISGTDDLENHIATLDKTIEKFEKSLQQLAEKITEGRAAVTQELETKLKASFKQLGLPNAEVKCEIKKTESLQWLGNSTVSFLFKANKGGSFEELKKAASGGELSRVMLALKYRLAEAVGAPVLVLDEIDTGVSGAIAQQMGIMMKELGKSLQVISITHSPQVASQAQWHFKVKKDDKSDESVTTIQALSQNERLVEIAQMLSGETITDAAMENAKLLMKYA